MHAGKEGITMSYDPKKWEGHTIIKEEWVLADPIQYIAIPKDAIYHRRTDPYTNTEYDIVLTGNPIGAGGLIRIPQRCPGQMMKLVRKNP